MPVETIFLRLRNCLIVGMEKLQGLQEAQSRTDSGNDYRGQVGLIYLRFD